jgi:diamine N-acetyltransferase
MNPNIYTATITDIDAIIEIANATWPETYLAIIGQEQLDFMLTKFYSSRNVQSQIENSDHLFLIYQNIGKAIGYAHCLPTDDVQNFHLSKLYVLPAYQGQKIGIQLLEECITRLKSNGINSITLNVNRFNKAKEFYEKFGFKIIQTIDIHLDKYWLNDYVMKLEI